jgi:hypothetical protein
MTAFDEEVERRVEAVRDAPSPLAGTLRLAVLVGRAAAAIDAGVWNSEAFGRLQLRLVSLFRFMPRIPVDATFTAKPITQQIEEAEDPAVAVYQAGLVLASAMFLADQRGGAGGQKLLTAGIDDLATRIGDRWADAATELGEVAAAERARLA